MREKPPRFPRLPMPPPSHGSPEWRAKMQMIVDYIEESCAFYRAQRKRPAVIGPLKPGPWWRFWKRPPRE